MSLPAKATIVSEPKLVPTRLSSPVLGLPKSRAATVTLTVAVSAVPLGDVTV